MQYTVEQLAEILAQHKLWRETDGRQGQHANLYGADLYGADLYGAGLYGADLYEAGLYGADLYGANLARADLREAGLRGADLYGAKNIWVIGPIGSRRDFLYAVAWPDGLRLKTGCFWGTVQEFYTALSDTHRPNSKSCRDYEAALAFLATFDEGGAECLTLSMSCAARTANSYAGR